MEILLWSCSWLIQAFPFIFLVARKEGNWVFHQLYQLGCIRANMRDSIQSSLNRFNENVGMPSSSLKLITQTYWYTEDWAAPALLETLEFLAYQKPTDTSVPIHFPRNPYFCWLWEEGMLSQYLLFAQYGLILSLNIHVSAAIFPPTQSVYLLKQTCYWLLQFIQSLASSVSSTTQHSGKSVCPC